MKLTKIFLCCLVACALARPTVSAENTPPHIVLIMADDMGWGDAGFNGGTIPTPHLDKLAAGGVRLDSFYVQPVCTPTRGTLMTGRYPMRLGLQSGVVRPWATHGLPLDERTLPDALRKAGYATAIFGKWHLGHSKPDYLPTRRGFDQQLGHYNGAINYFTHERDGGHDWHKNDTAHYETGYATDLTAAAAIECIAKHDPAKPLFLYLPFSAPHTPLQAPEPWIEKFSHIKNKDHRIYAAMMASMDDAIGKILASLGENGFDRENTLVFFCSDNGALDFLGSNGPFRGQKAQLYEGGIRSPAVISWPGKLKPGTTVKEPLHIADLYPTLLKLAGADMEQEKKLDGRDAWPTIALGKPSPHEVILHNVTAWSGALRMGKWKLLQNGGRFANDTQPPSDDQWELFDIVADPGEKNNLFAENPEVVADLRARLEALRAEAVPANIAPNEAPPGFKTPKVWGEVVAQDAKQDAANKQKPNIILINADDLGYGGLGCYGQKLIQTPNIDRMAAEGIRFTDFYAASAACVPSRVGMLTGRHPGHAAIRDNFPPHADIEKPNAGGFRKNYGELWPPKEPTLGRVIKDAGYRTAQFGKLEAGIPMAPGMMTAHGWDHWLGFRGTGDAFQFYPLSLWENDREIPFDANRDPKVRREGILGDKGVYSQDLFVENLLKFIGQNRDERFFIYFPTQVPHGRAPTDGAQIQVPDIGPYADRDWTEAEKLYAAMLTRLDGHVGEIIDLLKKLGIDGNTIVLFTSDNGDENSYYGRTDRFQATGGLRGKKRFLHEGGIRVPMIARWPGHIGAGQTSNLPWAAWDLMATFAELAGTDVPPHTDGISVVPTLLGRPDQQTPREYLYWEYQQGKQQAVRMGRWKGIRVGGTKEPVALYDLSADIGETRNLAEAHPDIVRRIRSIMQEAREGSEFSDLWQIPEQYRPDIKTDQQIIHQLIHGVR